VFLIRASALRKNSDPLNCHVDPTCRFALMAMLAWRAKMPSPYPANVFSWKTSVSGGHALEPPHRPHGRRGRSQASMQPPPGQENGPALSALSLTVSPGRVRGAAPPPLTRDRPTPLASLFR
jgi:hypothetical protein